MSDQTSEEFMSDLKQWFDYCDRKHQERVQVVANNLLKDRLKDLKREAFPNMPEEEIDAWWAGYADKVRITHW